MTPSTLPGSESVQAVRLKAYRLALTLGSLASVPGSSPDDLAARIGLGADALDELRALIEAAALPIDAGRILGAFHAAYEGPELPSAAVGADPTFQRSQASWGPAETTGAVVPDPLDEFSIYIAENEYPDAPRNPAADGPEPAPEADPAQDLPAPIEELPPQPLGIEELSDNPFAPQAQPGEAASI